MVTVTWLFCVYPATGVKTAVSPSTCQPPAMCGERVGIGVLAASGAENWTLIGAAPLTFFASLAGVTDSTWIAAAGWTCRASAAGWAPDAEAWLPSDPEATTATPAPSTSTAPLAVSAAPRRFHRDRSGLPTVAPSPSSNDCCLRNLPDRDTTPSLHLISQLDNRRNAYSRASQEQEHATTSLPPYRRAYTTEGCRPACRAVSEGQGHLNRVHAVMRNRVNMPPGAVAAGADPGPAAPPGPDARRAAEPGQRPAAPPWQRPGRQPGRGRDFPGARPVLAAATAIEGLLAWSRRAVATMACYCAGPA